MLMRRFRNGVTLLASIGIMSVISAQEVDRQNFCKHNDEDMLEELIQGDPVRAAQMAADEEALEVFTQQFSLDSESGGSNYVIPVVFHIIHDNGVENISDAQVHDALRVLNEDFNKLNADTSDVVSAFANNIADIGIEFRLAQLDPFGACTKGINRIVSELTYEGDQAMKNLIQWPRDKYLNVWTCADAGGAAGYTFLPGSVNSMFAASWDGIVLLHNYTGSIGSSNDFRSRTLTHEVGHWLNLPHPWGGTNTPGVASNCFDDDNVSDTPNTVGWTSCNTAGTSCGSLDNVQNYMDYSYCTNMFTNGQKARMIAALNSGTADRDELWQPSNLASTGTAGNDILCQADFSVNRRWICAGDSIQFTDDSYHGVTQRTWTFQGGVPSTSTDETPWVRFDTPGDFTVDLVAGNGSSTVSETRVAYITVLPSGNGTFPAQEGFESLVSIPSSDWFVLDGDADGSWFLTDNASYSGSNSVMIDNDASDGGKVDELISGTFDMTAASDINVSFRFAYAKRNSSNDDVLRFFVSKDCGASWVMRKQIRASSGLSTSPTNSGNFLPSSANEWGWELVDNINSSYHVPDFRFKFTFESDGGNNVFVDDININGTPLSVEELTEESGMSLNLFPSPVTDQAELSVVTDAAGELVLECYNVVGELLWRRSESNVPPGSSRYKLDFDGLTNGVYLLQVVQNERREVRRFVKN